MEPDQLSATFAALADPTRRAILAHLMSGRASVSELAEPFEVSMPAISRHLKVLEQAGLIARSHEAQQRFARIQGAPLKKAADWIENYRMAWEQNLERLDHFLRDMAGNERKAKQPRSGKSR